MLKNVQVKAGAVYPIYGQGLRKVMSLFLRAGATRLGTSPRSAKDCATVVLPDDVKSGTFNMYCSSAANDTASGLGGLPQKYAI